MDKIKKRDEVDIRYKWRLEDIISNEEILTRLLDFVKKNLKKSLNSKANSTKKMPWIA